ncbi:phage holin family protein [Flavobacterium foetidum]|uniref:phage holin family protein n=1 Tax=Flavobacterium foetidum TaxID=2026681 RepID=UPI001074EC28|nr:phage holin family protein [Flavobacterium foetidum]KAF2511905.1 phage holin family protein [Flavobacterium foetidum]
MKILLRLLVTAALVLLLSILLTGVHVASFGTAVIVAVVLGLLNLFIKPILVVLTLPVTVITLGLFLLVINAIMIIFCTKIVGGFAVDSFLTALIFSVILSILQSITYKILGDDKK